MARQFDPRSPEVRITLVILAALAGLALFAAAREAVRWSQSRRLARQQPYHSETE